MKKLLILLFSLLISFNSFSLGTYYDDDGNVIFRLNIALKDGFRYLGTKREGSKNLYFYDCKSISKEDYKYIKSHKFNADEKRMLGMNIAQRKVMKNTIKDEVKKEKLNCPSDANEDVSITAAQLWEKDGGKTISEIRKEKARIEAKNAELTAKREKKKAEERKIAAAKRLADNKRAEEWAAVFIENARIQSKTNPGFRDLKPGMPYEDFKRICFQERCYGIENIKFSVETKAYGPISTGGEHKVPLVSKLILDMGPITSDGLFLDIVNDLIESDSNIYRKMKRTMDTKYALDFEFSERDRQLFNEKEKRELLVAYSNGQVVLKINRRKKENSYSEDLWLYIEYRDVDSGKLFLKGNRPVAANLNDF